MVIKCTEYNITPYWIIRYRASHFFTKFFLNCIHMVATKIMTRFIANFIANCNIVYEHRKCNVKYCIFHEASIKSLYLRSDLSSFADTVERPIMDKTSSSSPILLTVLCKSAQIMALTIILWL